jgi:Domain of unknown function (DUF3854)
MTTTNRRTNLRDCEACPLNRTRTWTAADHFDFLLSAVYDEHRFDCPAHVADVRRSALSDATIRLQKISDVPPHMIGLLLGFSAPKVRSAYLIPFPDPRGGWMEHVRMKIFPSIPPTTKKGGTIKYLQPRGSGVRVYFPLATLDAVLYSGAPLFAVEGEKKALSVAQLGLPAIGISGIEGWHVAKSHELHPDFGGVPLRGRSVRVIPDADFRTNPNVHAAVQRLVNALAARGATAEILRVPDGFKGVDDWLAAVAA